MSFSPIIQTTLKTFIDDISSEKEDLSEALKCIQKHRPPEINDELRVAQRILFEYLNLTKPTPIEQAIEKGDIDLTNLLIALGTNLNCRFNDLSPVHHAAFFGNHKICEILIDAEAPVDARGTYQHHSFVTPLHLAAMKGHTSVISLLLKAGASINAKDVDDMTPLHFAALFQHPRAYFALVWAGADRNAWVDRGYTPFHIAVGSLAFATWRWWNAD